MAEVGFVSISTYQKQKLKFDMIVDAMLREAGYDVDDETRTTVQEKTQEESSSDFNVASCSSNKFFKARSYRIGRREFEPENICFAAGSEDEEFRLKIQDLVYQKQKALYNHLYQYPPQEAYRPKRKRVTGQIHRLSDEDDEDDDYMEEREGKKMKKKRKLNHHRDQQRVPIVNNAVTDRLKEFITNELNGTGLNLLIQKRLYMSDLKDDQNRLSMPLQKLETEDFLNEEEKKMLWVKKGEMEVRLIGPTLEEFEEPMTLKIWSMNRSHNFVFITNWKDFVKKHSEDLVVNTLIQVWYFRRNELLTFALACVDGAGGAANGNA